MRPEFRLRAYIRATLVTRDFGHSKNCAVTNQVPLGRYFLFVGSLLLGMLFISDWHFPKASSQNFFSGSASGQVNNPHQIGTQMA
jgi:hypothetical protein